MLNEMNFVSRSSRFFAAFDAPGSASAVLPERAAPEYKTENPITIDDAALPYLVGERKTLAEELAELFLREARQRGFHSEIRIAKLAPRYDETKVLEVRQTLATNSKRAMEYFEQVDGVVEAWGLTLTEAQRGLLENEILIDIEWNSNAPED